jgi:hypothetical protein
MFRNTRAALAAMIIPAALIGVGCAKKTVVGKWTGTMDNMPMTMEFKEDKSFTQGMTVAMAGAIEVTGTWSVDGEKLAFTATDVKAGGRSVMAMVPANMKSKLSQNVTFKLESGNLILIGNGQSATLTPVK